MWLSGLFINNRRSLREMEIKGTVEVTSQSCLQSPRETSPRDLGQEGAGSGWCVFALILSRLSEVRSKSEMGG